MLTLAEIESTLQIEFELRLEALDEQALRQLLLDAAELHRVAPHHLSLAEARSIVQATLDDLYVRQEPAAAPTPEPAWPWALLGWLWTPLR